MLRLRRPELFLFLLAIAVRLIFYYATRFTADDAFITFRYAENFGSGNGFVYNLGEHVLGTSTPLFTFMLAVLSVFRIEPIVGAIAVSLLCSGAVAIILYRFANSLRFTFFAALPSLCYTFWPRSIVADSCGMETALFTLLVTAALYFQHRRLTIYALGMATLATVTRPEGLGLLGLLFFYNLYRDRSQWIAYLLTPSMILIPWILIATYYFGSPIPNSIFAKLALYSRFGGMSIWDKLILVMGWNTAMGFVLLPVAVVGAWWLWKKQNFGALELVWLAGMFGFLVVGPSKLFFWYVAPVYPILLLFAASAVVFVFERLGWLQRRIRIGAYVVSSAAVLILTLACYRPYTSYRNLQKIQDEVHKQVGLYLQREARPDDLVAAEDIGYMGYYSRLRIIDRDGLVSPEVEPYNRSGQYGQVIRDFKPDWVVLCKDSPMSQFAADSSFAQAYHQVAAFAHAGTEYRIYKTGRTP
jgi:arabinofuranosyltransferase